METDTAPQVQTTRDYNLFKYLKGNRKVSTSYLKRLSTSILERNLMMYIPIQVNENLEIIDGQHRYELAKANNLPVFYIIIPHANLKEVHLINNTTKAWTYHDYLKSYIDLGNTNYQEVSDFCANWNVNTGIAISLLSGGSIRQGGSGVFRQFREGTFVVSHRDKAEDFMVQVESLRSFVVETKVLKDRAFLEALRIAFTFVYPEIMLGKFGRDTEKIGLQVSVTEYLRILERIYNHRLSIENNVRFF